MSNNADVRKIVERARKGFQRDLLSPNYAQIISDSEHLKCLLNLCEFRTSKSYLDIGTGNGYIAFDLARQNPTLSVTGIDIVGQVIKLNNQKAKESENHNLRFITYDGVNLPFSDNTFHGAISRYAFHHFPQPAFSSCEIYRILEPGGWCIISDPMANPSDEVDFVNSFGALKKDGHVRYYTELALIELFKQAHFEFDDKFYSSITFPREIDKRYKRLLSKTESRILDMYKTLEEKDLIYITVKVMNIRFKKPVSTVV